jgi:acetyl-CoA C-acetyltransferase
MEFMWMCDAGEAPKLIRRGVFDMNGELPINPSGGVLSTNPIGATGLIRIGEAALQIMGRAGERQVSDVRTAMATAFGSCYWFEATILRSTKP